MRGGPTAPPPTASARSASTAAGAGCRRWRRRSSADLDLRVAHDLGASQELGDRLFVVLGVGLLEEGDLLEEATEAALHDLGDGLLGLALVAAEGGERLTL